MKKEKGMWLEKFMNMSEQIPESFRHDDTEVRDGEIVIRILPPNLLELAKMLNWLGANFIAETEKHRKICLGNDTCVDFHRWLCMAKKEMDAVSEIFYMSVRYELEVNPFDFPLIGVRKGGVIVSVPLSALNEEEVVGILAPPVRATRSGRWLS